MNITIRRATERDKDFIITTIISAEKSGTDIISYCRIFSISEEKFRGLLSDILEEDIDGQELCISGYLIAEVNGCPAAAFCGWVEHENALPSSTIKANLLNHFLERDIIFQAAPNFKLMNEIDIARAPQTLQVEMSYTVENYRGLGLCGKLVNEHIRLKKQAGSPFDRVQVITFNTNRSSIRAYEKIGFQKKIEKQCTNNDIFNLLPSDTKILMEKALNII
jgi:ribosomal protein S18 acetylase RimI-like enzyme